ncbi:hypothetical protein CY35_02G039500 [Sphagnum magellanicum]|nr:hypothetical protein CY35_02G039500 [Sphagnum magellanicum]
MAWVELGMRWKDEGGVRSRKKKGDAPHNKDDDDGKSKNSIANCRALKSAYHDCFNRWYSEKFVKGQWEKEECMVEWETYRACVLDPNRGTEQASVQPRILLVHGDTMIERHGKRKCRREWRSAS